MTEQEILKLRMMQKDMMRLEESLESQVKALRLILDEKDQQFALFSKQKLNECKHSLLHVRQRKNSDARLTSLLGASLRLRLKLRRERFNFWRSDSAF